MIKTLGTLVLFASLGLCISDAGHVESSSDSPPCYFHKEEQALYTLLMEYRKNNGLNEIPLSKALTMVAHAHTQDLNSNFDPSDERCNTHSWSEGRIWEECCYYTNHTNPECMWDKPRELTYYEGNGYEIVVSRTGSFEESHIQPQDAIDSWKKSPGHNNVILNKDIWKDMKWEAIGISIEGDYVSVWFGEEGDRFGEPHLCTSDH